MAPELDYGNVSQQGSGKTCKHSMRPHPYGENYSTSKAIPSSTARGPRDWVDLISRNPHTAMGLKHSIHASPRFSTTGATSPPANSFLNPNRKAPDNTPIETNQNKLKTPLSESIERAAIAERKAAEYQQAKESLERQLNDRQVTATALLITNEHLATENESLKDSFSKIQKHTQDCENAANQAQKDAQNAKGYADFRIDGQRGQLRDAEKRYDIAAKELKEWKGRYGSVEELEKKMKGMQESVSEWRDKAETAANRIASLLTERELYQNELQGMLREEVAWNAEMADSLVRRSTNVKESLDSWTAWCGKS